jgi:type II secretory pathway predicted ATPase ExeA
VEYLHHFELNDDPFRNDHLERFIAETPSQTEAYRRLDRAVRQGRGLVALVGPAGCGKTVVARRLYEELEEEVFEASMMVVLRSQADSEWLMFRLATQLGVEDVAQQREALIEQIYERLAIVREDGRHAVLIIDDADALATRETLAELCALVKLEYEDRRMLTVVLSGSGPLDRVLCADPGLAHHLEVRVEMAPFSPEEAVAYLGHRLMVAGGTPELLLPGAATALGELSKGAPGRMNILADNALFEAYAAGRGQVARSDVERAYANLGWDSLESADPGLPPESREMPPTHAKQSSASAVAEPTPSSDAPESHGALDSELEAVFAPMDAQGAGSAGSDPQTVLMDFDTSRSGDVENRALAAPTEIQLGPADVLEHEGPPKETDAVDDLFMELIED